MKTRIPEDFTVESICRAYELNLVSMMEARYLIGKLWGADFLTLVAEDAMEKLRRLQEAK